MSGMWKGAPKDMARRVAEEELIEAALAEADVSGHRPPEMRCSGCGKTPKQIPEYVYAADDLDVTPDEYVWDEEGTLNRDPHSPGFGHFLCTECLLAEEAIRGHRMAGPDGTRWVAP